MSEEYKVIKSMQVKDTAGNQIEGHIIDDETVGEAAWSSEKIVELIFPKRIKSSTGKILVVENPIDQFVTIEASGGNFTEEYDDKYNDTTIESYLEITQENLVDWSDIIFTSGILSSNGNIEPDDNYITSDFIPVSCFQTEGRDLCLIHDNKVKRLGFYYGKDLSSPSSFKEPLEPIVLIDTGKYIRFSIEIEKGVGVEAEYDKFWIGSLSSAFDHENYFHIPFKGEKVWDLIEVGSYYLNLSDHWLPSGTTLIRVVEQGTIKEEDPETGGLVDVIIPKNGNCSLEYHVSPVEVLETLSKNLSVNSAMEPEEN